MTTPTFDSASEAATIALQSALAKCNSAKLNPSPHASELTKLVTSEVRAALTEMAQHQTHGGPTAIIMLKQPFVQAIYFADAGRRAAESLLKKLNIQDCARIH